MSLNTPFFTRKYQQTLLPAYNSIYVTWHAVEPIPSLFLCGDSDDINITSSISSHVKHCGFVYIKIFRLPQIKPKIAAGMLYDRYPLSFDYSLCIPRSFQLVFMLRFLANRNVAFFNFNKKNSHFSLALWFNFYLLRAFSLSGESYINCAYIWIVEMSCGRQ